MSPDQEQGLRILDSALWRVAHENDCPYTFNEKERPSPCDCACCVAKEALAAAKGWRFRGAHYDRVRASRTSWPREAQMHEAWAKLMGSRNPDHSLARILRDDRVPSARDWYVATSVVQWLATNVGMTVLEAAGFKYQQVAGISSRSTPPLLETDLARHVRALLGILDTTGGFMSTDDQDAIREAKKAVGDG